MTQWCFKEKNINNFRFLPKQLHFLLLAFSFSFEVTNWNLGSNSDTEKITFKQCSLGRCFIFILQLQGLNDILLNLAFFFITLKNKMYQMDYKCSFIKKRNYMKLTLLFSMYLSLVLFWAINLFSLHKSKLLLLLEELKSQYSYRRVSWFLYFLAHHELNCQWSDS